MTGLLKAGQSYYQRNRFFILGSLFELALIPVALVLGYLLHVNPLAHFSFSWLALGTGIVSALPMIVLFLLMQRYPLGGIRKIQKFFDELLCPQLVNCRWWQLGLLSLFAGFGEEILFRGLFQPWFAQWDGMYGLLGSNLLFGLAHAVTKTYVILAVLAGGYLGLLLELDCQNNLLLPITTHAVYDFVALMVLMRAYQTSLERNEA